MCGAVLNNHRREHDRRVGSPLERVGENLGGGGAVEFVSVICIVRDDPERDIGMHRVVFDRAQGAVGSLDT